MTEIRPKNSINSSQPAANTEKRYEPVNDKPVEAKPKSLFARALDEIFHFNGKSFVEWAVMDVAVPGARDFLSDLAKSGIDMIFYGGPTSQNRTSGYTTTSYQKYYQSGNGSPVASWQNQKPIPTSTEKPDYRSLVFTDYGKAQWALNQLKDDIQQFGRAKLGDYIDMANNVYKDPRTGQTIPITPEHVDYSYGWIDLRSARVVPAGAGLYRVELPIPAPLDY